MSGPQHKILIKNGTVLTFGEKKQVLPNYDVLIEGKKIVKICPTSEHSENFDEIIDASGQCILPGFINAHMHFYSSMVRGLSKAAPSKTFQEVLENLWWRLDKKLTVEDSYYSAKTALIEAIKHGTTTLIDHHASPFHIKGSLFRIADAVKESGLRANLCYEVSDRDGEKIMQEGIDENIEFLRASIERKDKKLFSDDLQFRALFGLHASFTLSEETLSKCVAAVDNLETELKIPKGSIGFHVHTAEGPEDQVVTMNKLSGGRRIVKRLFDHKMLRPTTICAHAIHIEDEEIALLKQTGTNVVHNPQSNMNNAVGVANVIKMFQNKIECIGLGTDAMTTNMLEELRCGLWIQKLFQKDPSCGFMELCSALFDNNRKIVEKFWGQSTGIGELKEGGVADVILMPYLAPTPFNEGTLLGHMVFGLSQSNVSTTICNGVVLMKDHKLTILDEEEIMKNSRKLSEDLWNRF